MIITNNCYAFAFPAQGLLFAWQMMRNQRRQRRASGVYGENGEFNHRTWFEQSDFTRFFPSKMGNLWDIPELVMKVSNWENHG
jgi:hypothetical protein